MRLNGWQRIGIVASVIWAISAPSADAQSAEDDYKKLKEECVEQGLSPTAIAGCLREKDKVTNWNKSTRKHSRPLARTRPTFAKNRGLGLGTNRILANLLNYTPEGRVQGTLVSRQRNASYL
jgi:hypothetical protein